MRKQIIILSILLIIFSEIKAQQPFDGYTLYNRLNSKTTYLIDMNNSFVHSWSSQYSVANTVYLLENGHILRPGRLPGALLNGGAAGGVIEEIDWSGNVVWHFEYSSSSYLLHHDIARLPNGNVLAIAWEVKSGAEAIQAGRSSGQEIWPLHIIEVEPTGASGGNIVWEWHAWDHLVQDYDPSKDNYGVVAEHPELFDVNLSGGGGPGGGDWVHANGIDYNEKLDQIVFSSHTFDEFYIIDHSTTTAEAAGHTGGNSGKGGDILYRWGNPQNYDLGTSGDQVFYVCHDAHWIDDSIPDGGNIMIFNNGDGRPGGNSSSVDIINPPVDSLGNYSYTPAYPFLPLSLLWTHTCQNYSNHLSGAQRLPNGNTMVIEGTSGHFYEIAPNGTEVWDYSTGGQCTRAFRYAPDYPGLTALFTSIGDNDTKIAIGLYPNPTSGIINISNNGSDNNSYEILVFNTLGKMVGQFNSSDKIDISNLNNGIYIIKIINSRNEELLTERISLIRN